MSSEYAVRQVTARKHHRCANDFAHDRAIRPGQQYWRVTTFRGSDAGYASFAGHPVQMKICGPCYQRSGNG
jgi:hypothetical protein